MSSSCQIMDEKIYCQKNGPNKTLPTTGSNSLYPRASLGTGTLSICQNLSIIQNLHT